MRIAIVHDWLTSMRGGEYVLEAIVELFPRAELFTLLYVPGKVSPILTTPKRHTSWLQRVPKAEKRYRHFLPLMPQMIEKFDLAGFDLVLSSSHCVAKGVRKPEGAVHVSYVHAPMRYMWDRFDEYFGAGRASFPTRLAAKMVRPYLQKWDRSVSSEKRIDSLIANSQFIADRIQDAYGRRAKVVYPFVNLDRFLKRPREVGRNYLMVGAFAPYKRVDLAIQAFNELKLPLLIVGSGQEEVRLKKLAGPTIDFLGSLKNSSVEDLLARCRAFVFPGKEDFGITPLEALASGAPVLAFNEGGAAETVTEETGVLFRPQTVAALKEAVLKIETQPESISPEICRRRAQEFSRARFHREFSAAVRGAWQAAGKNPDLFDKELAAGWAPPQSHV